MQRDDIEIRPYTDDELARIDEAYAAEPSHRRGPEPRWFEDSAEGAPIRTALDKTRARILQILQLDKENEQLLLRYSLAGPSGGVAATSVASPSPSILQKIYQRHS